MIVLPNQYRIDTQWGNISQVDATLSLLRYSHQYGYFDFYWLCSGQDFPITSIKKIVDYFELHPKNVFLNLFNSNNSGLSKENHYTKRVAIYFPLWMLGKESWKRIIKRLYIEITGGYYHTFRWARRRQPENLRFFWGSQWICVSHQALSWVLSYLNKNSEYYQFMRNCSCPDESFFQTLIMNSPFAKDRKDYLHYIDWSEGKSSPKILRTSDYKKIVSCKKLMARKFDETVDSTIIAEIEKEIIKQKSSQ